MPKRNNSNRVILQNAFKTLAANIRFSSVDTQLKTISIVSSIPDEGKTAVSVGLGRAFASSRDRVLMVECDMRRRSLANALGSHGRYGLFSVLSGRHTLQEAILPTSTQNMFFLDAEQGIPNPVDILQSKRFKKLLDNLKHSFDYIILDTPPINTFVDAAIISSLTDATILVVRQNFTKREEVQNAYDQLKKAGANVIGTVLNHSDVAVASKYYNYYHEKKHTSYQEFNADDAEPSNSGRHPQFAPGASNGTPTPNRRVTAPAMQNKPQQANNSKAYVQAGNPAHGNYSRDDAKYSVRHQMHR